MKILKSASDRALAAVMGLGLVAACGGGSSSNVLAPSPGGSGGSSAAETGVPPGTGVFTQSPIDVALISPLVPIGNLNPPDHTLPTNHAYFFHPSLANAEVRAPAGGTVGTIQRGADDQVYVNVSGGFTYYLAHIRLDAEIAQGGRISAGQRLGVTASAAGAMDLGVINNAVTLFFVRPERYIAGTLHGDSPFKYFTEPVKSELYAKVARTGADKDGQINFDRTGRLAGNWFLPDLQPSATENFGNGSKHLAFVRDVADPDRIRISIGGSLAIAGAFYVQAGAPDPAEVSTANGTVSYQLFFTALATQPAGALVVQMLADDRIKVEAFPGASPSGDFTDRALTYIR